MRELKNRGVEAVVESAGVLGETGIPANEKAISVMAEMGLDIANHKSRGISSLDLSTYDKIVCLTYQAYSIAPEKTEIVEVNNPYEKGLEAYRTCAKTLARAAIKIAEKIVNS